MIKKIIIKLYEKLSFRFDNRAGDKRRAYYLKKYNVKIGKYTYGINISNTASGTSIGSFCSIASGVKIGLMNHPTNFVSSHPFLYYANRGFVVENKNIPQLPSPIIEDDVWIGTNAIILPGVVIHKGTVVAAGAVVNRDTPLMPLSVVSLPRC